MKILNSEFFNKSTIDIARELLGKYIVFNSLNGEIIGEIIETEAYLKDDPASHSYLGKTKRNSAMFEKAGTSYVYFTYGMYYCFNIVTNVLGVGEAVLIRAIKPVSGIEIMKKNRGFIDEKKLVNGPAKFTMAFGLDKGHNGLNLLNPLGKLRLVESGIKLKREIKTSERIGISKGKEKMWRFWI